MNEMTTGNITCREMEKYISAFVDQDYTGLSDWEMKDLERTMRQCAHCAGEKSLELATKLYVEKHHRSTSCPSDIFVEIQAYLYHIYKSKRKSGVF